MKKSMIFLIAFCCVFFAHAQRQSEANKKLSLAAYAVANLYVDDVDENKLTEDAIRGMLKQLDPHSVYVTAEDQKDIEASMQGNFDGIGIQFNMNNDTLYVVQTVPGGPSEKVGIMAGDRIIAVNDTVIAGVKMKNTDIMKRLRGTRGSKVNVKVLRRGVATPLNFRITRDQIPIHSVDAAYMIDKNTGYIRLNRFAGNTSKEVSDAIKKLKKSGMKNLIFDLQGNGGGYLKAAFDVANEFLSKGESVVNTQGRHSKDTSFKADGSGQFKEGKIIFLVDEGSASASEIVSGAIQDWDRGVIVGRRTFGKGLVQRELPFADGSVIRLTTARYYTPSGRCIQKPYEKGDNEDYQKDLINRYNNGELSNADSIHFPDSLKYTTLKNHRTVYGGGGIMPDYFVPLDTTFYTDYHRDLVAKGILNQYIISYIDTHRKELTSKYKNLDKYISQFQVSEDMLNGLIEAGKKDSITYNEKQFEISKPIIQQQLKALIARDLFDMEAYFKIINQISDSYRKALEIIGNNEEYDKLLKGK